MFSPKSFIVLLLHLGSWSIFSKFFVYIVRSRSSLILLHVGNQLFQHHLFKRLVFPPLNSLALKINCPWMSAYFWTFNSVPLVYMSTILPIQHYFDSFIVCLELKYKFSNLFLFYNCFGFDCFGFWRLPYNSMWILGLFFHFCKKDVLNFDGDCIESVH